MVLVNSCVQQVHIQALSATATGEEAQGIIVIEIAFQEENARHSAILTGFCNPMPACEDRHCVPLGLQTNGYLIAVLLIATNILGWIKVRYEQQSHIIPYFRPAITRAGMPTAAEHGELMLHI
jgi:hypothetical protein